MYTGTIRDRELLTADGCLTADDDFEVVSDAEVRARLTVWIVLKTRHTYFWGGYSLGRADATPTPKDSWLKSLLRRVGLG